MAANIERACRDFCAPAMPGSAKEAAMNYVRSLSVVLLAALASCATAPSSSTSPPAAPAPVATIDVTAEMGSPHPGEAAPDFTLKDQTGADVKLSSLKGNVVVVSFVTSWCPYSKAEQPHLAALASSYAGKAIKFVAVDIQEDDAGYQKYLARTSMPMPVVRDLDGKVAESFVAPGAQPKVTKRSEVPIAGNVVVDKDGVINAIHFGDLAHYDAEMTITKKTVDALLSR
jgi:peroxiredoxin